MKSLLIKLFSRRAEPAIEADAAPLPTPAPTAREPGGKRKYRGGKRRHTAPHGARKIDPNGPWLEQMRGPKQ